MDPDALLARLRHELEAFASCLSGDLSRPVRHCGAWTVYDLADHLGRENDWVVAAVTKQRGDYEGEGAPNDPGALHGWFDASAVRLLDALSQDPEQDAWTIYPPSTVGFWRRRRAVETMIHRWDAEHALGLPGALDPALSAEGVAEVTDTMFPRQVKLGRTENPDQALRLRATDTGESWILGPGTPAATVSAAAPDLLLLLWSRLDAGDPRIQWDGDEAAGRSALDRPVTP